MSRLMSVAHTTAAVRDRTKTVTRRVGWWTDKRGRRLLQPGDMVTLCAKVMGRRYRCDCADLIDGWSDCPDCDDGWCVEPLERICDVEVVSVIREKLNDIVDRPDDPALEGFPEMGPYDFIAFFCDAFSVGPTEMVTRIEWRYLDEAAK